jgi:hypothetical protein
MVYGSVNVSLGLSLLQVELEPDAADLVLGLIVIMIGLAMVVGGWLFLAYVFSRIGRKFGIGSFGAYCVPIYNMVLLCRCGGISGWVAAGVFAVVLNAMAPELYPLAMLILFATGVYLWGSIAQRLGKNFWGWGIGSSLFGIPILFLAFDSSTPIASHEDRQAEDIIYDARFDDDDTSVVYDPIPELVTVDGTRHFVRFLTGEYAGQEIELSQDGITIGRDPARANLVLGSPQISGQHVRLSLHSDSDGRLIVEDLGSTNGTYIKQPATEGTNWIEVHGSFSASTSMPCRIRLANGAAEFEVS